MGSLNRSLLLLPTLGPTLGSTLDIIINLCLALLINFFEELDVLIVTVIIFFESALDFFKFLFNVRDLKNTKRAKPIDDCRAFLHNFLMHILEFGKSKWIGRRAQTFERRRRRRRRRYEIVHVVVLLFFRRCHVVFARGKFRLPLLLLLDTSNLEQVNLAEQLTSSDFGISTGLINQNYWENSKWYYVNVERGNAADKLNGRNINVSFTNNSNEPVEVMVFIFYSDEITIDVQTGLVTRHKN